jgi:hypothetical protein
MAVRLAAVSLQLDDSPETRREANRLARGVETIPPPSAADGEGAERPESNSRAMASQAIEGAVQAIGRGDHEVAERLIDTAVAAGWGRNAAQRLRAASLLAQGQRREATRVFRRTLLRGPGVTRNPVARTREAVTGALIRLESGDAVGAVRAALSGLALAREGKDGAGESACLRTLALCYEHLGRADDAKRIHSSATNRRHP